VQQTKLTETKADPMVSSLLSCRSLGIGQAAALRAALPSPLGSYKDGGHHPQSWIKGWIWATSGLRWLLTPS